MALPTFTMRQMLESGVHFGHVTRRWNPKMDEYIFGTRQGIHILDLQQTVPMMYRAMQAVGEIVAGGGRVLWVGTKRQASEPISEAAKRCGQYYVNHRWLGGMMTNWKTISNSIKRLKTLEEQLSEDNEEVAGLTKKELLKLTRERDKLDRSLGGIKDMGGLPDIVFVIDTNKEGIAVAEANKLGIPVVGVIDSNSDPKGIDYPIPGNDDSIRAINFYCEMIAGSVLSGIQTEMAASGSDLGEQEVAPDEALPTEAPAEETPAEEAPAEAAPAEAAPEAAATEEAPAEAAPEAAATEVAPAEEAAPEAAAETAAEEPEQPAAS
ncbi:MAG: 30S ribosomal protein S2 [Rhodospirillaceae bacterium]|nr:30S ribosomal protein S2 [Rhodospirillaceae bacterium]